MKASYAAAFSFCIAYTSLAASHSSDNVMHVRSSNLRTLLRISGAAPNIDVVSLLQGADSSIIAEARAANCIIYRIWVLGERCCLYTIKSKGGAVTHVEQFSMGKGGGDLKIDLPGPQNQLNDSIPKLDILFKTPLPFQDETNMYTATSSRAVCILERSDDRGEFAWAIRSDGLTNPKANDECGRLINYLDKHLSPDSSGQSKYPGKRAP